MGNGAIIDLAEGEDISTVNPGRPNAQFDPFVQSVLGAAPGQIDPLKEIQAARERIDAGISTLSRETAALTGEEWEKTHRQGVKERRMRDQD